MGTGSLTTTIHLAINVYYGFGKQKLCWFGRYCQMSVLSDRLCRDRGKIVFGTESMRHVHQLYGQLRIFLLADYCI
jgi:hypothetical protein